MNKTLFFALFFLAGMFVLAPAKAQNDKESSNNLPTYKVAIFAPLYLDSIFDNNNNLKFKQGVPKFVTPGLEFVQGAQTALDSMEILDANIDAYIFDSKSNTKPIASLIKNKELDNMHLIIGSVKDADLRQLADFALQKEIPFISATYPNDGGITSNPYFIIENTTLKSHCEAIYSYVFQNHGGDKIFLCRKKGTQEDKVATYFKNINEQDGTPLIDLQIINFDSTITPQMLASRLDTMRQNVVIGGSLDESFANNLATACYKLPKSYSLTLIGMPNWDSFGAFYKKGNFNDFPICFTSPYFNNKNDMYSKMVKNAFMKKYKGKPGDMAYKGFENVYSFCKLLAEFPDDFMNHLNDTNHKVFNDFNFRPIYLKKGSKTADYIENKHVYFIRILNGAATKAW